jgi:hypothetical protein
LYSSTRDINLSKFSGLPKFAIVIAVHDSFEYKLSESVDIMLMVLLAAILEVTQSAVSSLL